MAKRVFLHVGTMKSASSYIQALCNCNVEALAESGVLWPGSQPNFLATSDLLGTTRERPGLAGAWEELKAGLEAWDGDALISNELLAAKNSRRVKHLVEALAPADVHVIITARDLGRTIPSQWQTGVRNADTLRFDEFLAALVHEVDDEQTRRFWRKHDVAAIVRRFSRVVPTDRISVVTVPPSGSDFALVGQRFASVLGIEPDRLMQPAPANASVGAHSAELLRRLNSRVEHFDDLHYKWAFKNGLARMVLTGRAGQEPPIMLTRDQLTWVRQRASLLVEQVASAGVRVVGDLADLMPPEPAAAPETTPPEATDAELVDVSLDALSGMGQMLADLRIQHEEIVDLIVDRLTTEQRTAIAEERVAIYRDTLADSAQTHLLLTRLVRRQLVEEADGAS